MYYCCCWKWLIYQTSVKKFRQKLFPWIIDSYLRKTIWRWFKFKSKKYNRLNKYKNGWLTWNTVSSDCQKVSKLLRGFACVSSKLNLPPKSCIPKRANITINRNKSSSRLAIERILFNREATKFLKDVQYLKDKQFYREIGNKESRNKNT